MGCMINGIHLRVISHQAQKEEWSASSRRRLSGIFQHTLLACPFVHFELDFVERFLPEVKFEILTAPISRNNPGSRSFGP
jgi:hypothetical protein